MRLRLLVGTLAWVLLTVVAAGWGIQRLFSQHIQAQLQSELAIHLDQLTAFIQVDATGALSLSAAMTDPRFSQPFSGLYWQAGIPDPSKAKGASLHSRSLWDTSLAVAPFDAQIGVDTHYTLQGPRGQQLLVRSRLIQPVDGPWPVLVLSVAADESLLAEPVSRFNVILAVALGILALGLMLAVLMQVWVGLRPLAGLRKALVAVRTGHMTRIEGTFPTEIQPLVEDFNRVLQSNDAVVERARIQSGNLAHALKTPLAVMANAASSQDPRLPDLVTEQIGAARQQIDYHLARARAAAAVGKARQRTPIRPLLQGLVRVMDRVHAARGLCFDLEDVPADLAFRGEAQDFQEMLGNVLDNAGKWAQHRVRVQAQALDEIRLRLVIEDDGPGLSAEQAKAVFQRGRRADERAPGSGLGLSIVKDLVSLYEGEVAFEAGSVLGGARLVLDLPLA